MGGGGCWVFSGKLDLIHQNEFFKTSLMVKTKVTSSNSLSNCKTSRNHSTYPNYKSKGIPNTISNFLIFFLFFSSSQ